MDCKLFALVCTSLVVLCDARGIRPAVNTHQRFGQWGRSPVYPMAKNSHHSTGQGRGSMPSMQRGNSLTHSLSLDNVNLAPGETKIIKQTIVLRGRNQGHPQKARNSVPNSLKSGQRRFRNRLTARRLPQYNNRGHTIQPLSSGLYLLRTSGHGGHPQITERNGVANLRLPIIHAGRSQPGHSPSQRGASHGRSHGPGTNGGSHAPNGHSQTGFSISAGTLSVSSGTGAGHLSSGNPEFLLIQQHPVSVAVTASATGNHGTVTGNTNSGVHLPASSVTYTNKSPKKATTHAQEQIVQTTVEPGEDPPEAP